MSDLIERLLNELTLGDAGIVITEPLCQEAADRIAALEAEVERLRKAGDGLARRVTHEDHCSREYGYSGDCTCGLTEALTHWQEVSGEHTKDLT